MSTKSQNTSKVVFKRFDKGGLVWPPPPTLDILNIFCNFVPKNWKLAFNHFYRYLRFMPLLFIPISRKQIPPKSKKNPKIKIFGISMTKFPKFGKNFGFFTQVHKIGCHICQLRPKTRQKWFLNDLIGGGLVWPHHHPHPNRWHFQYFL